MRQLPARGRATALAVLVVTGGASCAPADCDTVEPAYAGEASDEAWREMIDARADATTGGDAATFTAPAADAVLGRQAPTFTWDSPLELASSASSGRPELLRPRRASAPGLFDRVVATVLPAAHAHLPPVTGDVHLLEIDVPDRCPVAALTTELSFTFDDDDWATVVADAGPRTARLLSAFLAENNVTEGPFVATPLSFTVAP